MFRNATASTYKLFGSPITTCTKRVAVIFKEMNVEYELVPVDIFAGEQKTPAYLEKHPFKVPFLVSLDFAAEMRSDNRTFYFQVEDDKFLLFESRAIARYIASKYRGQGSSDLLPNASDLQATAKFEQAASMEIMYFNEAAMPVYREIAKE
jgi:glutathione S-transferase